MVLYQKALHIAKVFFACPPENLDNFQRKLQRVRSFTPRLSWLWDRWSSCGRCVLHIGRVWSTIVSFFVASVQNVQEQVTKTAPHLCVLDITNPATPEPVGAYVQSIWEQLQRILKIGPRRALMPLIPSHIFAGKSALQHVAIAIRAFKIYWNHSTLIRNYGWKHR